MISFPNAKINLGLNVVSKREDGYHNLETIFYPLMVKDALEVIISKDGLDSFTEVGHKTGVDAESNLVMKALKLMRNFFEIPPIEIHLLKKIPFGAGIGGGSADAAFMLKLLNDKFNLGQTNETLAGFAQQLGADCPFFIYNRPLFASGIGEVFEDVSISLDRFYLVLVKPDIHVSTKDAFCLIKPSLSDISLKDVIREPIFEWKNMMVNDFEKSIFAKYPEVEHIKRELYSLGALYASMSGSGSSVFGIFEKRIDVKYHFPSCYVWHQE